MITRAIRTAFLVIFMIIGGILGKALGDWWLSIDAIHRLVGTTGPYKTLAPLAFVALGIVITATISSVVSRQLVGLAENLEGLSTTEKFSIILGVITGVFVAMILVLPWGMNETIKLCVGLLASMAFAYLGARIFLSMKEDIFLLWPTPAAATKPVSENADAGRGRIKVLDTNVIIDGRIADVCRTGFIEGPIYVPGCVLEELHHIADSAESLKRARGRRGLDILNQLQKDPNLQLLVRTYDHLPVDANSEVDYRLVQLAKKLNGAIITNDFNLNKVAELEGVAVLNVNELANALKPVVLPGEEMNVTLIREGKESNQGVAYLEDGTMVVVEGGRRHIGETLDVSVTSVLQTVAGKMIFAEVKISPNGEDEVGSNMRGGGTGGWQRRKGR